MRTPRDRLHYADHGMSAASLRSDPRVGSQKNLVLTYSLGSVTEELTDPRVSYCPDFKTALV